jgi:hypothetical protein
MNPCPQFSIGFAATVRVLSSSTLFQHIIQHIEHSEVLSTLLVCKGWLELARNWLYTELDFRVFSAIAGRPVAFGDNYWHVKLVVCIPICFISLILTILIMKELPKDYILPKHRCMQYIPLFRNTRRFHDDSVFEHDSSYNHAGITANALSVIANSWIYGPIFPNLEEIGVWSSSLLPMFMAPSINTARIMLGSAYLDAESFISSINVFMETSKFGKIGP